MTSFFFCQCTRFSRSKIKICVCFSDITSEQQSSLWFVISFCLKIGKNVFIVIFWSDLRNWRGSIGKGEGCGKINSYSAVLFSKPVKLVECWNVYFYLTRTRRGWSISYWFLHNMIHNSKGKSCVLSQLCSTMNKTCICWYVPHSSSICAWFGQFICVL